MSLSDGLCECPCHREDEFIHGAIARCCDRTHEIIPEAFAAHVAGEGVQVPIVELWDALTELERERELRILAEEKISSITDALLTDEAWFKALRYNPIVQAVASVAVSRYRAGVDSFKQEYSGDRR